MNIEQLVQNGQVMLMRVGMQVLGAIAIWVVGRWLISLALRLVTAAFTRQKVEPTLLRYLGNFISVTLNILLVVGILGYFGMQTTSFAALIAGVGLAIGAAWGGLLANFAAGAFIIVLRPFKVGDYVSAGGVEGTVEGIGPFRKAFHTPETGYTPVGKHRLHELTAKNYSTNPYRRVDRLAQLDHSVDVNDAIARLKPALAKIPNIMESPAPDVELVDFTAMGPVLAVRPYCHTAHYWQVYFDANKAIRETFGAAGYPVPEQHLHVKQ